MLSEVRGFPDGRLPTADCNYERRRSPIVVSAPDSSLQTGLLEDSDLPGVIKLVLHDAVQHEANVVLLAGHALAQSLVGQTGGGFDQGRVCFLQVVDRLFPGGGTLVLHRRKILRSLELKSFSLDDPAVYSIVPCSDM